MPNRSRTARAYSARLRRWNGRQPGFGDSAAAVSSVVSSASTNELSVAASGRRAPGGGIMPARSLRIIFSPTSAWLVTFAASNEARESSPACPFSLWHEAQYCATSLFCASIGSALAVLAACATAGRGGEATAGLVLVVCPATSTVPHKAMAVPAYTTCLIRVSQPDLSAVLMVALESIGRCGGRKGTLFSQNVTDCQRGQTTWATPPRGLTPPTKNPGRREPVGSDPVILFTCRCTTTCAETAIT